jgi:hypothetical protein
MTFADLPLPNANEYPYNLQGDQTKARALAAAASAGDSSALEKLRSVGLDQSGNVADGGAQKIYDAEQAGALQRQNAVAQDMAQRDQQMQQEAQMRQAAQQLQAQHDANAMKAAAAAGAGGGGGQQKKEKEKPKPQEPPKQPRGGGRGRGGSRLMPPPKVSDKAKQANFDSNYDARKDKTSAFYDPNMDISGGWDERKKKFEQGSAKYQEARQAAEEEAAGRRDQQEVDAQKAAKERKESESGTKAGEQYDPAEIRRREEEAKRRRDKARAEGRLDSSSSPKMVHAYGNRHSKVMVRARGDMTA